MADASDRLNLEMSVGLIWTRLSSSAFQVLADGWENPVQRTEDIICLRSNTATFTNRIQKAGNVIRWMCIAPESKECNMGKTGSDDQ